MSQNTFEVVFSGKLVEGAAPEKVKAHVAALFKVEVGKVERLFSGATVSIKKGVDEQTAKKYQMALYKAGAICQVVNRAAPAVAAEPKSPAADPATRSKPAATPQAVTASDSAAEVGLQKSVVKAPPQGLGELGSVSIDAPGTTLVEHQEVAEPQIDTASLSMDPVGVELSEHEEVAEPQVDISGLSMGDEGEAIGEETPFEALEVDVSAMSMDDPGVTLVEHKEEPEPEIDTSRLSLE